MHPTDKSASVTGIVYANSDHRHVGQGLTQTLHTKELLTKQQVASESFKLLRDLRAKQVDRDPSHGRLALHVGHQVNPSKLVFKGNT